MAEATTFGMVELTDVTTQFLRAVLDYNEQSVAKKETNRQLRDIWRKGVAKTMSRKELPGRDYKRAWRF